MLHLLLCLLGVRLEARGVVERTYVVRHRGTRLGEITFSGYEAHHSGAGWQVNDPPGFSMSRYRTRWWAALALVRRAGQPPPAFHGDERRP